jgi:tetratricopeptide (TPR) repeat protein
VHLEAIPLFEKSLNLMETHDEKALSWNRLGNAYRQIGDYSRAVSAYQLADEYRGKSAANQPEPPMELTTTIDSINQTESESPAGFELENPDEQIQFSSSLESKESRVDLMCEESSSQAFSPNESEEDGQVLDGDNLSMLDKTISEIEEIISRNNNNASDGEVNDTGHLEVVDNASENDVDDDRMTALEWNELGNTHLKSGSHDDAIFAYTKAIEMAPEFNWPYIKNLAVAYYHKGKNIKDDQPGETDSNEFDENPDDNQGLGSLHELHDLSEEIFDKPMQDNAAGLETSETQTDPENPNDEEYTLDESSVIEPFSFDPDAIGKDLLLEALQEDMEFSTGKLRDGLPASRELVENRFTGESNKFNVLEPENTHIDITPGKDRFEVQPQSAYEWNELGNIYLKIGSNEKASDAFKKAIELDPYFGWAYSNLALSYNHSKKFKESISLYKKSIDLLDTDKGKAISWNRLGDVYRHLNDQDNAMKAYQMASDLDGDTKPILARARMVLLNNA